MKKNIFLISVFMIILSAVFLKNSFADNVFMGFDDKTSYDIYFYNGYGSSSVIKNIKIFGFKDFGDKTFLIIKAYDFKLKDTQGYVLLDSVTAILPNQEFRIETRQDLDIRYK